MKPHILLIDDNMSRSADRRSCLHAAGVEVTNANDGLQAVEALNSYSLSLDAVCVDSQFLAHRDCGIDGFPGWIKPLVPVVLITDDGNIPYLFEKHVDVVIDRPDFDAMGGRLIQDLYHSRDPFFLRWFDDWTNRVSRSLGDETTDPS